MEKKANYIWTYEKDDPAWDDFVASLPDGHYEQSTCWARVREAYGWQTSRLKIERNGEILAGAQILSYKIPFIGKVGHIPYGPCVPAGSDELTHELLVEVKKRAAKERWRYVVMNLSVFGHHLVPVVEKTGFLKAMKELPPKAPYTSTLLIDLSKDLDGIFSDLSPKTRRCIRVGTRGGLQFREGARKDIDTFFRLMLTTCERRKTNPLYPDIESFYRFWDSFYEKGGVRLFFIEYQAEPVCSALCFSFGQVFSFYQFGWTGKHPHLQSSKVLYWKTIEWSKNMGFRYFDFVNVDTEVSKAIEGGFPVTQELQSKYFYGPTVFKMSFGGIIVHLPGQYVYFNSIFLRVFSNVIIRPMLKLKWLPRAIYNLGERYKKRLSP